MTPTHTDSRSGTAPAGGELKRKDEESRPLSVADFRALRRVQRSVKLAEVARKDAARQRRHVVREISAGGVPLSEMAEVLGVSRPCVHQLAHFRPAEVADSRPEERQ